ncbi:hypothetical protein MMC08_005028 [Hypocenomyce scalaris]|nr:hypothetical protein [Hypocenomyce scalaris]
MTTLVNTPAPNTPYFTPIQAIPAGAALSPDPPKLFQEIKIRDVVFQNRIWVAPMCTFSADNGHLTDFHFQHLAAFAFRGAGLTMIEATSVSPEGRISPEDAGLWCDSQIAPIKRIANFLHSQGQKLGIQLSHAGRKASTVAPWLAPRGSSVLATEDINGWPSEVIGPSAISWGKGCTTPNEMSTKDIEVIVSRFGDAARRSVEAGVDVIELHGAHGYLIHAWLSPVSNKRTDEYGGSFENRIRVPVKIIEAVRAAIPSGMPLFLRISATEWLENVFDQSWTMDDALRFAKLLPALGVDLLDVSSAGSSPEQKISVGNSYQVGLAGQLREALRADGLPLLIGAVGLITEPSKAEGIVAGLDETGEGPKADVVLIGRQFLREPEWVLRAAHTLGLKVQWPRQYQTGKGLEGNTLNTFGS